MKGGGTRTSKATFDPRPLERMRTNETLEAKLTLCPAGSLHKTLPLIVF